MTNAIICGAKTASGLCLQSPVSGRKRCFRHGGAPGSGAPKGSQNAYKHGYYTREDKEERRELNRRIRELRERIEKLGIQMRGQPRPR